MSFISILLLYYELAALIRFESWVSLFQEKQLPSVWDALLHHTPSHNHLVFTLILLQHFNQRLWSASFEAEFDNSFYDSV